MERFKVGDTVTMKRYPTMPCIVMKVGQDSTGKTYYQLRFADQPNDTRGHLIWDDAIN